MSSPNLNQHDSLEAGLLNNTDRKATSIEKGREPGSSHPSRQEGPLNENMPSPRHLLLTLVVCLLVTLSLASVLGHGIHPCLEEKASEKDIPVEEVNVEPAGQTDTSFAALLRSASPDILHRLLHAYFPDRYQHGVYPSDQDALVAVHEKNAPLATTLAQLAKRQNGNSTETPPPDTSEPPPDTSEPTPDPTDTPDPDPTPTDDQTANTNPPAQTSNTPDPTPDPTPTEEPDDTPDTKKTTRTPSKSASATTMTSTLPDGGVTVITSTSFYDVYPAEETDTDTRPSASLQNAAPRPTGEVLLPVVLGMAVGGFMAA